MLEVRPFRAHRFDPSLAGLLDDVITPPWDVIGPEHRAALAQRNPYNMVHLILPQPDAEEMPADAAGRRIEEWIARGVLQQEDTPCFYLLEQEFADGEGYVQRRRGFFAVTRLPEPGQSFVLGHERTFDVRVDDRLRLTRATRANLGPVFVLYDDSAGALSSFLEGTNASSPSFEARTHDGVIHRVWITPDEPTITRFFADKKLYIADGHHRFRTAMLYRDEQRAIERPDGLRPYDYVLMGFVAFQDPGLRIYPPHRMVSLGHRLDERRFLADLEPWFEVHYVDDLPGRVRAESGCAIGLILDGIGQYLLRLRPIDRVALLGNDHGPAWRNLDVAVLHRGILERILGLGADTPFEYECNAAEAIRAVREGRFDMAFLLKPSQPEDVAACAEAGDTMPQKATYFFPKLPSGAVIHRLV
ncbi:MAG TPA: DUF1015 domain-containing protein [Candidatus Hydrogenedentes bacterium]|nr:DUF1015 domain-containing protein [Candidatus Hydrogenedentota bacterium]HPG68514.1 DUF1015 domain-containing protein [Candidatus Hydrogenedentota bacterium]